MSKRTTQTLFSTLCNIEISLGSIPAMGKKVSRGLAISYNTLAYQINKRQVAYVDETSFRECAKTHYIWTATTKNEALICILSTRRFMSLREIRPRDHPGAVNRTYGFLCAADVTSS